MRNRHDIYWRGLSAVHHSKTFSFSMKIYKSNFPQLHNVSKCFNFRAKNEHFLQLHSTVVVDYSVPDGYHTVSKVIFLSKNWILTEFHKDSKMYQESELLGQRSRFLTDLGAKIQIHLEFFTAKNSQFDTKVANDNFSSFSRICIFWTKNVLLTHCGWVVKLYNC